MLALLYTWQRFTRHIFWQTATLDPWSRPGYWLAARLAYEGQGELIYGHPDELRQASVRLGTRPDIYNNLPITLLPYMPVAHMAAEQARAWWAFFGLACFVAAWTSLLLTLRLPLWISLASSALVPFFQPWILNTTHVQIYSFVLLTSVAGAILAARALGPAPPTRRTLASLLSGISYALAIVAKSIFGLVAVVAPLARRQWKVVAATIAACAISALLTLLWVTPQGWAIAIQEAIGWRELPVTAITAYQTLNGFLMHLFNYHPDLNPAPLATLPWLVGPLWWAAAFLILGLSGWVVAGASFLPSTPDAPAWRLMPYALFVPVSLLLSPIAEDYAYTLAVFPLLVSLAALWDITTHTIPRNTQRSASLAIKWAILVAAIILLAWPWNFIDVYLPDTYDWGAFRYYPRLYGILLLWGLMLYLLHRHQKGPYLYDRAFEATEQPT